MNIDIASLYLILGLFFFLLPVAVFVATSESRDRQVYWWCIGGLGTSCAFLLIGLRGVVPSVFSFYVAHIALAIGFCFRSLSLRLEISPNIDRTVFRYAAVGLTYVLIFSALVHMQVSEFYRLNWVHGFLVLMSLDVLFISRAIYGKHKNKGGKLIAWMAIFILVGLLVRMLGYTTELGGKGVFDQGTDQYIGIFFIMIGYVLGNFGFIQLRLEKLWENKKLIDQQLVVSQIKNQTLEEILEEKNALMRTLSLSAKANSMGTMLGAIAHEINQPLGAIRLNTELLMALNHRSGDSEGYQVPLGHILQDTERAAVVVSSLRKFFTKGSKEFVPINVSELVRDACSILLPEARLRRIDVHTDIAVECWSKGDQNQLQMVVLNLITNAIEAVAALPTDRIVFVHLVRQDARVVFEVSDNGPGITAHQESTIFELFHTTKETGMGMGLWLSRAVMDSHEGFIKLLKGPANETMFHVSLPTCASPSAC